MFKTFSFKMASSQEDLDKSFNDLKEMFPAMDAPRIWSAYLANKGDFGATLVSWSRQWIRDTESNKLALTVQDQLLAMDVQQGPVSVEAGIGNRHSHGLDISLEDRLCTALLQSPTECFEAVASRMQRHCNTTEVQNVTTKLNKFLR